MLSQTVTITVTGDQIVEADEAFTVTLSSATGAVLDDAIGVGIISNDDSAAVTLTGGPAQSEGDSGTVIYPFTATLSSAVQDGFALAYTTDDGSATTADGDYRDNDGVLTFAGTLSETQVITVSVTGDTRIEADETFSVTLSTISGTVVDSADLNVDTSPRTATILNDDVAQVAFALATDSANEAVGTHTVAIQFTGATAISLTQPVTVVVSDARLGSAGAGGVDYSVISPMTLTFPQRRRRYCHSSPTITDDTLAEGDETLVGVDRCGRRAQQCNVGQRR
ncbi:MAG: Calx-beta domain-containing protein [Caldilineaceae bacterium]